MLDYRKLEKKWLEANYKDIATGGEAGLLMTFAQFLQDKQVEGENSEEKWQEEAYGYLRKKPAEKECKIGHRCPYWSDDCKLCGEEHIERLKNDYNGAGNIDSSLELLNQIIATTWKIN